MTSAARPHLESASHRPAARAALAGITAYEPGMTPELAALRFGPRSYAKLSSNENPFGPSPRAVEAAIAALAHPETYPDSTSSALRGALAEHLARPVERVVAGPGSEALIDYFFRAYLSPGDAFLLSRPTFPSYEIFARSAGARIVDVPRTAAFDLDVAAIRAALGERPRAMALCTPNNPTGSRTPRADLAAILEATSLETVVLLDEAYFEFHDEGGALDLLEDWGGVFMLTRTFSKAYGLAGLRAGYGVVSGPEVIDAFDRLRPAFNLTSVSQAAAMAALADQAHMRAGVAMIVAERRRVEDALAAAGVVHTRSQGNFIFVRSPGPIAESFDRLLAAGVIVRPIPVGSGHFRITLGEAADNDSMLAALTRTRA
ncbi:MAG TPA: histidinol-phosphate transaminase [Caulobacteraceae bacterium]|jgi:histidinol-phosphate aminotransferase|nr:histidinol-phosphate transaminase [Caulobacteraceae bacterium]